VQYGNWRKGYKGVRTNKKKSSLPGERPVWFGVNGNFAQGMSLRHGKGYDHAVAAARGFDMLSGKKFNLSDELWKQVGVQRPQHQSVVTLA
jgi:hypothetical protein